MNNHEPLSHLYRNLQDLADHCMRRFRVPNDRSLVHVLGQPSQINNRSALICWIGEELMDPEISSDADLSEVLSARLALLLVHEYPHRWAEILGDVLREHPMPDFVFLQALRCLAAGSRS